MGGAGPASGGARGSQVLNLGGAGPGLDIKAAETDRTARSRRLVRLTGDEKAPRSADRRRKTRKNGRNDPEMKRDRGRLVLVDSWPG